MDLRYNKRNKVFIMVADSRVAELATFVIATLKDIWTIG